MVEMKTTVPFKGTAEQEQALKEVIAEMKESGVEEITGERGEKYREELYSTAL